MLTLSTCLIADRVFSHHPNQIPIFEGEDSHSHDLAINISAACIRNPANIIKSKNNVLMML